MMVYLSKTTLFEVQFELKKTPHCATDSGGRRRRGEVLPTLGDVRRWGTADGCALRATRTKVFGHASWATQRPLGHTAHASRHSPTKTPAYLLYLLPTLPWRSGVSGERCWPRPGRVRQAASVGQVSGGACASDLDLPQVELPQTCPRPAPDPPPTDPPPDQPQADMPQTCLGSRSDLP